MASDKATLPVRRSLEHKQLALQSALQVLASGSELDRADTPDEVVTAVRRLPAVEAAYAPFPAGIDPRLHGAAALSTTAHLEHLVAQGKLRKTEGIYEPA